MDNKEPLLLSVSDICTLLNIQRTLFYNLVSTGAFGPLPVRLGRRRLYKRSDVMRFIELNCPPRERFLAMTGGGR